MTSHSDAPLDDLPLDVLRIVDQLVEFIDIADEILAHAGLQSYLLINECIDRITMVSESVQRSRYVFVVDTAATVHPLSYGSNAKTLIPRTLSGSTCCRVNRWHIFTFELCDKFRRSQAADSSLGHQAPGGAGRIRPVATPVWFSSKQSVRRRADCSFWR